MVILSYYYYIVHREYVAFMKRVAAALAEKWHKPYGVVMSWV